MSGTTTPLPKTMSSRLLTMKFMQRAAASSPLAASPSTPDVPSPKRRKTESGSTPTKFDVNALADQRAIEAAMASEEAKRQVALEKLANDAGDTRWVLNFEDQNTASTKNAIRIEEWGFATLDHQAAKTKHSKGRKHEENPEPAPEVIGRKSFGKFNRVVEVCLHLHFNQQSANNEQKLNNPDFSDSEASGDDEEDDDVKVEDDFLDDDDPTSELIRASRQEAVERVKAERKTKKRAEKSRSENMAKERKKREVSLNGITSLSGRQEPPRDAMKCHNCEGPHKKADCPHLNKRRYNGVGDDGPKRKVQKH